MNLETMFGHHVIRIGVNSLPLTVKLYGRKIMNWNDFYKYIQRTDYKDRSKIMDTSHDYDINISQDCNFIWEEPYEL